MSFVVLRRACPCVDLFSLLSPTPLEIDFDVRETCMRDSRCLRRKEEGKLSAVNGRSMCKVEVVRCNIDIIPDSAKKRPPRPRSCDQWQRDGLYRMKKGQGRLLFDNNKVLVCGESWLLILFGEVKFCLRKSS